MAAGDIIIAKETSVQNVLTDTGTLKTDTTTLKADTATVKTLLANGATNGDSLSTVTSDYPNVVVNLTGKYELLAVCVTTTNPTIAIQIDGATNRKTLESLPVGITNLVGLGIKCISSIKVTSSTAGTKAFYRLLP